MKVILLQLLLLNSFWCQVKCEEIQLCNNTISISCPYEKVIVIVSAPASIARYLSEKCNARQECSVINRSGGCVNIEFVCYYSENVLEMKKSTAMHLNSTSTWFVLMTEGYNKGKYQTLKTMECNITLTECELSDWAVEMYVQDFLPSSDTTEYCLNLKSFSRHALVSSSQGKRGWNRWFHCKYNTQFSFNLTTNTTAQVPSVRFWSAIYIYHRCTKHVKCHFEPATTEMIHDNNKGLTQTAATKMIHDNIAETTESVNKGLTQTGITIIASLSVVCGFFCLTTAAFIFKKAFRCRQSNMMPNASGTGNEHEYAYIDLPLNRVNTDNVREENTAQSIEMRNDGGLPSSSGIILHQPEDYLEPILMDTPQKDKNQSRKRLQACGNPKVQVSESDYTYADEVTVRGLIQASRTVAQRNPENLYVAMDNPKDYENMPRNRLQVAQEKNVKPEDIPYYLELH